MDLAGLFGSIAFFTSLTQMSSPIPSLYEGFQKMEAKSLTLEYFIVGCIQSFFWFAYGYKLDDFYACLTNTMCVLLFLGYTNVLLYINRLTDKALVYNGAIFGFNLLIFLILNGKLCLLFGAAFSSVWHFTMLKTMKSALTIKDPTFINFTISLVSLANFFSWLVYSLLTKNYLMAIPNTIGVTMWSLNLVIYFWANEKLPNDFVAITLMKSAFSIDDKTNPTPREPLLNNLKTASGRLNL